MPAAEIDTRRFASLTRVDHDDVTAAVADGRLPGRRVNTLALLTDLPAALRWWRTRT